MKLKTINANELLMHMKRNIYLTGLLLLFFPFCTSINAQNNKINNDYYPLVQEGKMWITSYPDMSLMKETDQRYCMFYGDTTIDGKVYKKIYTTNSTIPIFPKNWKIGGFMREDEDKKVWQRFVSANVNEEGLIYDFSLQIGDSFNMWPFTFSSQFPPLWVTVTNITYETMLDGETRKVIWFTDNYFGNFWIEGIGNERKLFREHSPPGDEVILKCYYENNLLIYNNYKYDFLKPCKYPSMGIETYRNNNINIYPNPVNNTLNIENANNFYVNSIHLANIQGQIIKQFESNSTKLDVSDIPSGFYFIKLSTSSGNIIQKIVINQ